MKKIAWISLALTILLGIDGIYMTSVHYQPSDVNRFNLSDGGTILVAAVLLLVVTLVAFTAARKQQQSGKKA